MKAKMAKAAIIAVSMIMVAVSLAAPATADKEYGDKMAKGDGTKLMYINMGLLGDVATVCLFGTDEFTTPDGVSVGVDTDGDGTYDVGHSSSEPGAETVPAQSTNVCIGGGIGEADPAELLTHEGDKWVVWIRDYIWNGCDDATHALAQPCQGLFYGLDDAPGVDGDADVFDFASVGLAKMLVEYEGVNPLNNVDPQDANAWDCSILDGESLGGIPSICSTQTSFSVFRNTHYFGLCGQGSVTIDNAAMDPQTVSEGGSLPDIEAGTCTITKVVFVDGLLFYLLDCPAVPGVGGMVGSTWTFAATTVNDEATCNGPGDGIPDTVCIFEELPSSEGEFCGGPNTDVVLQTPVPGLVGEVGWNYLETGCVADNTQIAASWTVAGGSGIGIKGGSLLEFADDTVADLLDDEPFATILSTVEDLTDVTVCVGEAGDCWT